MITRSDYLTSDDVLRVAEIRARWAKATPGPWVVQRNGLRQSCGVETADGTPIQMRRGGPWGAEGTTDPDDAAIAHAPEDIAWLLAEVERLTTERERALSQAADLMKAAVCPTGDRCGTCWACLRETVIRLADMMETAMAKAKDAERERDEARAEVER